jgi:hypothetical protein
MALRMIKQEFRIKIFIFTIGANFEIGKMFKTQAI